MSEDDLKLVKECAIQLYVYALQRSENNNVPVVEDVLIKNCVNRAKKYINKINKILEE